MGSPIAPCDKCLKADKCQICGNLQDGPCEPCQFSGCNCETPLGVLTNSRVLTTMALKDEMLVRAMVLLKGINECYEFPKVKSWLQRYEGMMKVANEL